MKIVIPYGMELEAEALALMQGAAQVTILRDNSEETLRDEIRDANAIVAGARPFIDRSLIESAPGLKHIARSGVDRKSVV